MAKKKIEVDPNQLSFDFTIQAEDLFVPADLENIKKMLPQLYETQQEDVAFAEARFMKHKGVMFTNGTGTGKTFVGLGIIKRFYSQGQKDILIVVPTEQKSIDWIQEASHLNLKIQKLIDINDGGENITVTTYANFYQNHELNKRDFDLIVYDESHYLSQNSQGLNTVYQEKHKLLANLPSAAKKKAYGLAGEVPSSDDPNYSELHKQWRARRKQIVEDIVAKTKVVFLSATPFAYQKSLEYADGCLWTINETKEFDDYKSYGYNEPNDWESFMIENFGYRMRTNKLTMPESGVDQNLMEREFFEKQNKIGAMSTKQLILDYDYSRDFIIVDSEIGNTINDGMKMFWTDEFRKKYRFLTEFIQRKYDFNYINQLLEVVKAQEIAPRIQQHLDLDRKVVVFHGYNHSKISHPFKFDLYSLARKGDEWQMVRAQNELNDFNIEYAHLVNLDLSNLKNTREAILSKFPQARQFNGTVPKKRRSKYIEEFNTDYSMTNVLLVQERAGKEGISLHDKTGIQQRVAINLGLPTAPTTAIQLEGRIYRSGLKSNAIYEYVTVQTDFERIAFGTTIAKRSKTVENLAMGKLARDLEIAFKDGYLNASYFEPSFEQGTGGKDADRIVIDVSDFQKAITYYFGNLKKTSRNKSREGKDYFATPEPLGYKMVEWLRPQPSESGLEPSAGHGAIARFFPGTTTNKFIEPSLNLSSKLQVHNTGEVLNMRFEDYYIGNKYNFIAMNPPFGVGGKDAAEHLKKACGHMKYTKSRLLCIVPDGASMQKRLDKFYEDPEDYFQSYNLKLTGELILPACTFERAGTSVRCKILKIEKQTEENQFKFSRVDLSHCIGINDFFAELEHLNF